MPKTPTKPVVNDIEAEFSRLFWIARKEHIRLGKRAAESHPGHAGALAFAKVQGWQWAEVLLEASRLHGTGAHGKALELLDKCEPSIPSRWHGLFQFVRGTALGAKGESDEAIKAYRQALKAPRFDQPGKIWNNLGIVLSERGEHDEAIKAYRKALEDPGLDTPGNAWNNLAGTLRIKGESDEAIRAYHKALSDPEVAASAVTWADLGEAYVEAGRRQQAVGALKKALENSDPRGDTHARARFRLGLLESGIKTEALSPDDRAMVSGTAAKPQMDEIESGVIAAIQEAGATQYEKYVARSDSKRDNTLSVLRGWSSAVTLLEGSERRWRGGGFFLKWRGYGIAIDPGFDFLRNFHDAGYHGREINVVIVSHNHADHNSDLRAIDDLRYELFKRQGTTKKAGSRPYLLLWDQDTNEAVGFGIEQPQHHHEPVVLACGYPQPIDLQGHAAKIPLRVTPFKASHGSDVRHAMGMVMELLDTKGESVVRLGYTADTEYFTELSKHLAGCDILIANISQPSIEELRDASKLRENHLGYRGTARLVRECNPALALIGEFWAGFTDLRISLVKGLRQRSGVKAILPAGLGMHVRLPALEIECTQCGTPTRYAQIKVAPPTDAFGGLAYLCPKCMIG